MKPLEPASAALHALRKLRGRDPQERWRHPSVLDFTDGVEVTEMEGTLPGELQDLFPQALDARSAKR